MKKNIFLVSVLSLLILASPVGASQPPIETPQALWQAFTVALDKSDFKTALQYISTFARDKYQLFFQKMPPEAIKAVATATLKCPADTFDGKVSLNCDLLRPQRDGKIYKDIVVMVKDRDGFWRIQHF